MRTVYIADDGKTFNDEYECRDYEWKLSHPHLKNVKFISEDGKEFDEYFSEDTYYHTDKLVIPTKEALEDLHALAKYTGWCAYDTPTEVGTWVYSEEQNKFIKFNF